MDEIIIEAYSIVDDFLEKLNSGKAGSLYDLRGHWQDKNSRLAAEIINTHGLITYRKSGSPTVHSMVDISVTGLYVLKIGGIEKYLDQINEHQRKGEEMKLVEFEKVKLDLELNKRILKEYPRTKWFSILGFAFSVILLVIELVKFFLRKS